MSAPRRLLVVTPLDWHEHPNNLEQNRAAEYARRGWRVTVLYKRMNRSLRPGALLRDALTCRFRVGAEDGVRLVGVDPFLNHFAGLAKDAEERGAASTRRALLRRLAPLGLLREVVLVPCLLLAAARERERYDVCLGFGPFGALVGRLLRALGRVRVLVYEDRDWEPGLVPDRPRRAVTAALERSGIRRADAVVSIGELLAERRSAEAGRAPDAVIPSGVDYARFAPARAAERRGRRLVYVGNVVSWSGVEPALRALPALAERFPDVALTVVGGGLPGYLERLRELAAELGVGERVRLLGPRPPAELPALLAAAEVGLAASEPVPFRRYASPLKVMEYLAAGLPVVATEGTEAARLVARAGAGVAVSYEADEPAELTRALGALLADPERRHELGERGAAFARGVDWSALVERELAVLGPLLPAAPSTRDRDAARAAPGTEAAP